jgi:hypothetical protein
MANDTVGLMWIEPLGGMKEVCGWEDEKGGSCGCGKLYDIVSGVNNRVFTCATVRAVTV